MTISTQQRGTIMNDTNNYGWDDPIYDLPERDEEDDDYSWAGINA